VEKLFELLLKLNGSVVAVLIGGMALGGLIVWTHTPEPMHSATTAVATSCSGVVQRIVLGTSIQALPDCNIDYGVVSGEVMFNGLSGSMRVKAGEFVGKDYTLQFASWQASPDVGSAIVDVVFCPRRTTWDGKKCS
jgi:hypothetical protein